MHMKRSAFNTFILIFVLISMYFFWPTIIDFAPKVKAGIQALPEKVIDYLDGKNTEVKGDAHAAGEKTGENAKTITPEAVFQATNMHRKKQGLSALVLNKKLNEAAQIKVDDMIALQYFEHKSPTGVTVSDLGKEVRYRYITIGENLAMGNFLSGEDVVEAWMNSPGHRANIINKKYKDIGIAAGRGTYKGSSVWFVVQHFGTQRAICPEVDQILKKEIETQKTGMVILEEKIIALKQKLENPDAPIDPTYKEQVDVYNAMVQEYETLADNTHQKIQIYNADVRVFNDCLKSFQ